MPAYLDTLSNDILKQPFNINDEPNTHSHNQSRILVERNRMTCIRGTDAFQFLRCQCIKASKPPKPIRPWASQSKSQREA
jgi:hypothetical protein